MRNRKDNIALCVPTLNASAGAANWVEALYRQSLAVDRLIIDSSSSDGTLGLFASAGFRVYTIRRDSFQHGRVRKMAVELCPEADILIFMTQDAVLSTADSLSNLLAAFAEPKVGAAFGCQLPRSGAGPVEAHARFFNYPTESRLKSSEDLPSMGVKAAFISNSFAAYRRSALEAVGGFPERCIVSEDTFVAAKMILSGWKIAYNAEACVYHSHNYNSRQEFQRYFDIGVFHAREPWIREKFGGAEGEGKRFLKSEIKYLLNHAPLLIPSALVRTVFKYTGFRMGLLERYLPIWIKKHLSQQKAFWIQEKNR